MIYTITLNPALDKTALVPNMALNGVNRMSSLRLDPGGKGINVSKVIHALGGQSVAVGLLAGRCGRQIADACTALGLTCDFTFTEGETRTNLKIVDPAAHTNTDINEPGIQADEAVLSGMLTRLLRRLTPRDIVVLSGSLPQGGGPHPLPVLDGGLPLCGRKGLSRRGQRQPAQRVGGGARARQAQPP